MQVSVGCGTICVFHVGGFHTDRSKDALPRWELFVADRPHAEELDEQGRRQPFLQIAQAEALAVPGDVIMSPEVAEVTCHELLIALTRECNALLPVKLHCMYLHASSSWW